MDLLERAIKFNVAKRFDPSQPRDKDGRWARVGGSAVLPPPDIDPILIQNYRVARIQEREALLLERLQGDPEKDVYALQELKEAKANLKRMMATARVNIRVRNVDTLMSILDDGRFKSQFETGASTGYFGPGLRADVESRLFNIPNKVEHEPQNRPIYGYLMDEEPLEPHKDSVASAYGTIRILLKKSVNARTTFTGGDSLATEGAIPEYAPSPVNDPSIASVMSGTTVLHPYRSGPNYDRQNRHYARQQLSLVMDADKIERVQGQYVYTEAQVHGGVKATDIEEVHITHRMAESSPRSIERLKERGIRVVIGLPG